MYYIFQNFLRKQRNVMAYINEYISAEDRAKYKIYEV